MIADSYKSIEDIQKEIDYEYAMTNALEESIEQWEELIAEFETRYDLQVDIEPGGTWKTR